jgi:DNA-binding PadR family transcriptional regulator
MPNPKPVYLGEFEQLVLLAIMRLGARAYGTGILRELEEQAGRTVTRGAIYRTLDRLERKDLLRWRVDPGDAARGQLPRRTYSLTATGLASVRASHHAIRRMTRGLERRLGDIPS